MSNTSQTKIITLDQAKKIASELAHTHLSPYWTDKSIPLLKEDHLEAESCWMFFRNPAIEITQEGALADWAYCISKKGTARSIADFSDDPILTQEYLQKMSNHFKDRGL
jgi:hypothetical protein